MRELSIFVDRDSLGVYRYDEQLGDYKEVGKAIMTEDDGKSYIVRFEDSNLLHKIDDAIDYGFMKLVESGDFK